MSDYSKTTNFTAKDSLPTGNPSKLIKGSEFDTEFDALETAVGTKANKIGSAVTGDLILQASDGDLSAAGWGFPNVNADITATDEEINILDGILPQMTAFASLTSTEVGYSDGPNTANKFCLLDSNAQVPFAQKPAIRGCMAYRTTTQSISGGAVISFDSEAYDTDSIHEGVTNPTRLTVPSGVTRIKLNGHVAGAGVSTVAIKKNGAHTSPAFSGTGYGFNNTVSAAGTEHSCGSGIITVTSGDYFEIYAVGTSTTYSSNCWFEMEIIE